MFNFFLKSAFYYTVVNKYGKKLLFIFANIVFIIFIQFIYSDIIEILTINNLKDFTVYALLGKWVLILLNILFIAITLKTIVKSKKPAPVENDKRPQTEARSSFEDEILKKDTLKSKSDLMMEELLSKK